MKTATWVDAQSKRLIASPLVGYAQREPICAEPVAIAALAACGYGLLSAAEACCYRLQKAQNENGSVSVRLDADGPFWTTSLACIAWRGFERRWPENKFAKSRCRDAYRRGIDFLLSFGGEKIDPSETVGHDTQLVGWPWVQGTHSWLEPTAFALLALRHCNHAAHPRAIEAAELLTDRLLPAGGANYGNTLVLGQLLRPHLLPSAICLVALHRMQPQSEKQAATVAYLQGELAHPIAATSLAWSIQALVSQDWEQPLRDPVMAALPTYDGLIQAAVARMKLTGENPHRQNLLLLASTLRESPMLQLPVFNLPTGQDRRP